MTIQQGNATDFLEGLIGRQIKKFIWGLYIMAYDNRDPAYVPSQQALAADAYIASTSPETHPDEYTYYPGYGNTYTGSMANYTSGTEYNTWLNSSLFGGSMFGSGQAVADVYKQQCIYSKR